MTSQRCEKLTDLADVLNHYAESLFHGYPAIVKALQLQSEDDKAKAAVKMYEDMFGEK